ncbi:Uncharacterized protein HZ326_14251 [Fusarium oxysporum f. sp. albedinis]|nr:Uncharacterized protein HZ326_14251 [Fusarium oxysporum f. sp. albedinis]
MKPNLHHPISHTSLQSISSHFTPNLFNFRYMRKISAFGLNLTSTSSIHVRLRRALRRRPSKTSSHPKLFELKVGAHKASRRTPGSIHTTTAKQRTFPLSHKLL